MTSRVQFWCNLIILLHLFSISQTYNILVVFSYFGSSHRILGDALVTQLLKDGHKITYITTKPLETSAINLTNIDVSSIQKETYSVFNNFNLGDIVSRSIDVTDVNFRLTMFSSVAHATVLHEQIQKLMNDKEVHFDAVIAEWMFNEVPAGLAAIFQCPLIWMSSFAPHWHLLRLIDFPPSPAYSGDLGSDFTTPFTFNQRLNELWIRIKTFYYGLKNAQLDEEVYAKAFTSAAMSRNVPLQELAALRYQSALILASSHVLTTGEEPSLPHCYKSIGGYHIDDPVKPLPRDLKNILDRAENGFIYFSMGSMLQGRFWPTDIKADLISLFSTLNMTVIWKFEDVIPDLPLNIHILKWAPQHSILAHPNIKLFITHGGLLSLTEAVHFGVNVIGIPGFGDQPRNVNAAVKRGFAIRVDLNADLAKNLKRALLTAIKEPKYALRAKEVSSLFHDRIVGPKLELTHWVRHIIHTKGFNYLQSPAVNCKWYQIMYLDLSCIIIFAVTLVSITWRMSKKFFVTRKEKVL